MQQDFLETPQRALAAAAASAGVDGGKRAFLYLKMMQYRETSHNFVEDEYICVNILYI